MLRTLFELSERYGFEIVGVATDDPELRCANAGVRGVWKYGFDPEVEPRLVPDLCARHGLEAYRGCVKLPEFIRTFREEWQPDVCIMNVFGQFLPPEIFQFPALGCFNFHATSGESWPSYGGPDPFGAMIRDGRESCCLAMHRVIGAVDGGELIRYTDPCFIPQGATVPDMHYLTAPLAVGLLRRMLPAILAGELRS